MRSFDPVDLPAYRFYNLALFVYKEGLSEEQLNQCELTLTLCDDIPHPLQTLSVKYGSKKVSIAVSETSVPTPEGRHKYVPPWWQGEERAYENAKVAMGGISTLPPMQS